MLQVLTRKHQNLLTYTADGIIYDRLPSQCLQLKYRHVVFEKVRPAEKANHFESKGCCLMPASLFKLKNFKGKFPDTKKHSAARIKEGITFLLSLSENHHRTYVLVPLSVIQQKKWPAIAVHCSFLPNCSHEWNFTNLLDCLPL